MALDVSGLIAKQPGWEGLFRAGDAMEQRLYRQERLRLQEDTRKQATASTLANYLDPKDLLTGTPYDPIIAQSLQEAMQAGTMLASKGVDTPSIMMAIGPMVNKINGYSQRAKQVGKQIDESIRLMKESKLTGYDFSKIKQHALQNAFYDLDESGKPMLNPDKADASIDWVQRAIQNNPLEVTTGEAFDDFAQNAKMMKTTSDIISYDDKMRKTRFKGHLIHQNYLTPEYDNEGAVTGFVPAHDTAMEQGRPLIHTFKDEQGKEVDAPVRLLDQGVFNSLTPAMHDNIRGQVTKHLNDYWVETGKQISPNSPEAMMVARAIAYDELNKKTRKQGSIEYASELNKPSGQEVRIKWESTPEALRLEREQAAARKQGRMDVQNEDEEEKKKKTNVAEALGKAWNNDPDYATGPKFKISGDIVTPAGIKKANNREVVDITNMLPGGGLKAGKGEDFDYKGIYYDPATRSLLVQKESGSQFSKKITTEEIPEDRAGQFIGKVAMANGLDYSRVKAVLEKMGYVGGKFTKATGRQPQQTQQAAPKKSFRDDPSSIQTKGKK